MDNSIWSSTSSISLAIAFNTFVAAFESTGMLRQGATVQQVQVCWDREQQYSRYRYVETGSNSTAGTGMLRQGATVQQVLALDNCNAMLAKLPASITAPFLHIQNVAARLIFSS
jgi:hypothetical protein